MTTYHAGAPEPDAPYTATPTPREVDFRDTSRPLTRDLGELIDALYIVEAELRFQAERVDLNKARTVEEREHFERLQTNYTESAYTVRTLRRYQEGRVGKRGTVPAPALPTDAIPNTPVHGREEDDPHA